jgi:hypothetical protein
MKDATSIVITFVICTIVLLVYFLVGQSSLNRNNAAKAEELALLVKEEKEINWMGSQISTFEDRLPDLKRRINYYKLAVPTQIEDDRFFIHLASELRKHDAELLELQQSGNRIWLGQLSKTDEEKYVAAGLDVNAIKQIRTSTFKIRLFGDFNELLTVFENLKSLGRLYTIDQVISPAGGGSGTVLVDNSGTSAQMEITGSLFYGIPENYRDAEGLDAKYMEVAVIRNARDIGSMVMDSGGRVLKGYDVTETPSTGAGQDPADTEGEAAVQSVLPLDSRKVKLKGRG